jgi:hypothetical protein
MPEALNLEQIIRQECLPLRDCMLTLTDSNGEAAFLYFKEGELIEANYAALWGKEALAQIVTWQLADRTIAPLPLGIKRSLWDQLEFLLNPSLVPTASGRLPVLPTFRVQKTGSTPFDRYKAIQGLLKISRLENGKETILFEGPPERGEQEPSAWLGEFAARVKSVGDTLGFGHCDKWTIDTDKCQIVGLRHEDFFFAMLRRKDAMQDDLEVAVDAVTEGV